MLSVPSRRDLCGVMLLCACTALGCDKPKLVYAPPLPSEELSAEKKQAVIRRFEEVASNRSTGTVEPVKWSKEKLATETEQVYDDVRRMGSALSERNYEAFFELVHPALLNLSGKPEAAKVAIKKSLEDAQKDGIKIGAMQPAEPTFVESSTSEFVIVPTKSSFNAKGRTGESFSWQLGARTRGETKWRYIDGSRMRRSKVNFFPDFPVDFPIPEPEHMFDK